MKMFILVFGGVGVILLAIAAFLFFKEQSFLERAQEATGTITDFQLSRDTDGITSYCPIIEFVTRAGESVRYYGNVCTAPPAYKIGDSVQVLYDPQNLDHVQMKNVWAEYLGSIVLGLVGGPFVLVGLWAFFAIRLKNPATAS